ncbi:MULTISPECIES: SRPBCC family protein [unclassified Mycolicibacterium]|uniref:SRPBCC family protein n=1 Tax=unclassified Mycolicibacterium TaxID=2636767 RepID=UPI0013086BDF|nr:MULTISPECIES: SRPBCC family protein [unclassified Mycolicibacterium]MUL83905.1 carbon monoxide dehydrogenase [Mycolicibacterium sp. CBMA 329]MUL90029.1 carbon monoxide dehydrogenase [Mycolicibacterium sp. CBMA 331]MUL97951.1 carbon monoxide dehydrogenase [Mycolicibacterium sp. CBMA 334]MUM27885.1 carbon monoxide dehydrogenase [Mycolicibacterium sp. CBMA 295]MUM39544.1 carbon monoxide dehydrogenase [Mycolicibacterium sp. CBMA 247]
MELNNEFRVAVPAAKTWEVLTDVERVAPCLPGATLLSVDGDDFTGAVKVKVGPITVSYKGDATFLEKDVAAQRVVLKANGKETRGNGTASAVVTAQLKEDDSAESTTVVVTTDLAISGKAAQFGRGVLADVAGSLIDQFARSLEAELLGSATPAAQSGSAAAAPEQAPQEAAPINALALAKVMAVPMAKRFAPAIGAVAAAGVLGFLIGRAGRKNRTHTTLSSEDLQAVLLRLVS